MMQTRCSKSTALGVLGVTLAALLTSGASPAAAGEYRIQTGDVIEIAVAGLPQFGQRAAVQIDGTITVPLVGTLDVEGALMEDVRNRIQSAFASRLLPIYSTDGRETLRSVEREAVAATIVRYRPVWVSGEVMQPGEQVFEPRMTVRQAIAVAGGLRSTLAATGASPDNAIRFRNDYTTAWVRTAALAARVWRLRNELGEEGAFDPATLPPAPISPETLPRLLENETLILEARQHELAREKAFFTRAIELAEQQISLLSQQLESEIQNEQEDQNEYERAQDLLQKGMLTNNRVVDTRRLALFSATRKLQTSAQLTQVRRNLGEYSHNLEKIDEEHRMSSLAELQKAEASIAEERVRMGAAEGHLRQAGIVVPHAVHAQQAPHITVVRRTVDGSNIFGAMYEDELRPGDVVEVAWEPAPAPAARSSSLGDQHAHARE